MTTLPTAKPRSYALQKILCWIGLFPLSLCALVFTPMFISDLVTGNYKGPGGQPDATTDLSGLIGGFACAGLIPAAIAIFLIVRLRQIAGKERHADELHVHDAVLELAMRSHGRLTAVEVATHLNIATEAAAGILESMRARRLATLQVSESGVMVYHFDQIISPDEKNRAETV
jgi:hypothetical protein